MKDLYIFQVFTEYYLIYIYTLNLKKIRLPQLYLNLGVCWKGCLKGICSFGSCIVYWIHSRLCWIPRLFHSCSDIRWSFRTCLENFLCNMTTARTHSTCLSAITEEKTGAGNLRSSMTTQWASQGLQSRCVDTRCGDNSSKTAFLLAMSFEVQFVIGWNLEVQLPTLLSSLLLLS